MYALPFLLYYFYVGEVEASGSSGAGVQVVLRHPLRTELSSANALNCCALSPAPPSTSLHKLIKNRLTKLCLVVAHTFNASTWKAEAGGSLVSSKPAWSTESVPGFWRRIPSQKESVIH